MSKAGVSSALLSFCGGVSQLSRVELLCAFFLKWWLRSLISALFGLLYEIFMQKKEQTLCRLRICV